MSRRTIAQLMRYLYYLLNFYLPSFETPDPYLQTFTQHTLILYIKSKNCGGGRTFMTWILSCYIFRYIQGWYVM